MARRYTRQERNEIKDAIKAAFAEGKSYEDVALLLNEQGITTASGKQWNKPSLGAFCHHYRITKHGRSVRKQKFYQAYDREPRTETVLPKGNDTIEIATLILAANVSDDRKAKLLHGLFSK